jgi:metal-responsive CopG/Arc/MetJ family transcriptional regulator
MAPSRGLSARRLGDLRRTLDSRDARKTKTSISVSGELLRAADLVGGPDRRSALIERALRHYLEAVLRRARHAHDLAVLDAHAESINAASDELLALQAWPE